MKTLSKLVLFCATIALTVGSSRAASIPADTLNAVGLILTQGKGSAARAPIGIGFFVEVPSRLFQGSSFVYLLTAKRNLVDSSGRPITHLWLRVRDSHTGAMREDPLPPVSRWILDPNNRKVDLAATPFSPENASFSTISISRFLTREDNPIPVARQLGANAFYITALSSSEGPRLTTMTRFGRVSVADPTAVSVPGIGIQNLCFMEAVSPPVLTGSPVFLEIGEDVLLWGMIEASIGDTGNPQLAGLVGVLPVDDIAQTVRAMAAAQEQSR